MILAHATEPHLLIRDLAQSPFNVGVSLTLVDFDRQRVEAEAMRHGLSPDDAPIDALQSLLNGHPLLIRQALHLMAMRKRSWPEIEQAATDPGGPFWDHLQRCLLGLRRASELKRAMKQILARGRRTNEEAFQRLRAAGLVRGHDAAHAEPRCELYARYLKGRL
jgi:hypothetical protein